LATTPPAPATGLIGFATCVAAGDGPPTGFPGAADPGAPGRGGREILIVSFRKSAGGLATPGSGGRVTAVGLGAAPGTVGTAGGVGAPATGTPGTGGFGGAGGTKRIVSFFRLGAAGIGGVGAPGGLATGGAGGFRPILGGARGGFGSPGGAGGFGMATPGGRGGVGGLGSESDIAP